MDAPVANYVSHLGPSINDVINITFLTPFLHFFLKDLCIVKFNDPFLEVHDVIDGTLSAKNVTVYVSGSRKNDVTKFVCNDSMF
jgi:hypothetical protein